MRKIFVDSKQQMIDLAQELAASAAVGDIIFLNATLGAGKTFFAQNFINFLQEEKTQVLSPTFNLVYSYQTKKGEVFHFDLYRLKSADELENIGFFDAIKDGICLIEWPDFAKKFVKNYTEIQIKIAAGGNDEAREVAIVKFHEN